MTDIKALKALAETVIGFNNLEEVDADLYEIAVEQFEAAVNPAAVLELTKEIEQARLIASLAYNFDGYKAVLRERDQLKAINTDLHATLQAAKGEIDRLKADRKACWEEFKVQGRQLDRVKDENDSLRPDARRWQCVRNAVPMQSPYAVWREGSHLVLGKDADELVDNFLSHAKEASHG